MAPSLHAAWLSRDPQVASFFAADCRDPEARARVVAQASKRRASPELLAVLRAQNSRLSPSPAGLAHLDTLQRGGAAAVITGQQVGLFLGPLYTIYKAASAIQVARALSEETGVPCVPIFWLQTEDHDFPEIDHCELPSRETNEPLKVQVESEACGDRVPVRYRRLSVSVESCRAVLLEQLAGLNHGEEIAALVARHYVAGATVSEAFTGLLAEIFADEGLLFLDPRGEAVSKLWAPVLLRSIEEDGGLSTALSARAELIAKAGFDPQVHIRPGSPLLFFHPDGLQGPRFRLDREGEGYTLVGDGRTIPRTALLQIAEQRPWLLSSSALLRPVLQDSLFPTAAYVGGPGELAYTAQLGPLYEALGVPPPMFVPRASFRLIDPLTRRALNALGLQPADATKSEVQLVEQLGGGHGLPPAEQVEAELLKGALGSLAAIAETAAPLGEALVDAHEKTRATLTRAIGRYVARYRRARLERDEVLRRRIRRVRQNLQPDGDPQERRYAFPTYAAVFGLSTLKAAILRSVRPFEPGLRDLEP